MLVLLALAGLLAEGCSRTRYRVQADQEVGSLLAEKSTDARWNYPGYSIYTDPRSRFFDPTDPDHPPMPQDDPASHRFMHLVDGKRGWPRWHQDGDRYELENPQWVELLPTYCELTETGAVKLNVDSAVQLGQIHSGEFRQQIETLYLSSLDVSTERFRFDVQFFGGTGLVYNHQGRDRNPNVGETNTLSLSTQNLTNLGGTNTQASRRLATGGELLVGFANSFVWQFAGPNEYSSLSLLNFNFVQPLLRQGGRAVALEQLTIAERALLANLRALERYRQGFYTNIAIGDLSVTGPQRRGGFFGGTGLGGFSGQGSGGFGEVGSATNFGRAGFGGGGAGGGAGGGGAGFAGGGAGSVGGFIGLLQQLQQIRNQEASLNLQLRTLQLLEANLEANLIDIVQVDQFRQNIETERATLLQARVSLQNALDTYKRATLSLPPHMPMELDDTMIRQFQFIDPPTTNYQNEIADFLMVLGNTPVEPSLEVVQQLLDDFGRLRDRALDRFATVRDDLAQLQTASKVRSERMDRDEERVQFAREQQRLVDSLEELARRFDNGAADLASLRQTLNPGSRRKVAETLVGLVTSLDSLIGELSLVQTRARLETVTVDPIELDPGQALEIARANRLDWMNNRATVVDTWRLITFNANALNSNLQVTLSGDVGTVGDRPFDFAGTNGTMRAGLRFDAPFTRLLERNNYRQVLIDYQQDRRTLIRFEDGINQTLRQSLRQLDQLRLNLEIQRRAVAIAVRRVDKTRDDLNEPPPPVQPGQAAAQLGPTASLNLLTAISDLRNSQNNFMSVWLNYYAQRMQLYRELGIMKIDDRGMWVDVPLEVALADCEDPYPLPPAVPAEWLREAGVSPDDLRASPEDDSAGDASVVDDAEPPSEPATRAGEAPPMRSRIHLQPVDPEALEPDTELPTPRGPRLGRRLSTPPAQTHRLADQPQRLRANSKRWIDLIRPRGPTADLETSVY